MKTKLLPIFILTLAIAVALIAFAANSVFARLAMGDNLIDPYAFSLIRLTSGAVMLGFMMLIIYLAQDKKHCLEPVNTETTAKTITNSQSSSLTALLLFVYAICFSLGYVLLDTATGALVVFGAVQLTMILAGLAQGQRYNKVEWCGVASALLGFVYLVLPSIQTPSFSGFVYMLIAGIAWGLYTIKGQNSINPIQDTGLSFIKSVPLMLIVFVINIDNISISAQGVVYAVLSGVFASACGYAVWYSVLKYLSAIQAATLQLLVPILSAVGGILWLNELLTTRLIIATCGILGGILLLVVAKKYIKRSPF